MKKLGKFMKEKREAMGLSLQDASKLSGVSHTHIRDIEDGRSIPSFEMVILPPLRPRMLIRIATDINRRFRT